MSRGIRISGGILLGIIAVALVGPLISPHSYDQTDFDALLRAPTLEGLLRNTEQLRDLLGGECDEVGKGVLVGAHE